MTAAFTERISDHRRQRLQSLCERARKTKPLLQSPKRQQQWKQITDTVQSAGLVFMAEDCMESAVRINGLQETAEIIAADWKKDCQAMSIGVGWLSFFFWRFFMPILIQLAKDWLAEHNTVTISGVAVGESAGGV